MVACSPRHSHRPGNQASPRQAASEKGFNDFQVEGEAISFEHRLEKIETRAAPILKRMITERQLTALSAEDRRRVAEFIAAQSFRTKAFYEGLSVKWTGMPLRANSRFCSTESRSSPPRSLAGIGPDGRHRRRDVLSRDNPTVLQRTDNPRDGSQLGFDVAGVEAFLPLTPRCALYMPCRTTSEERVARYNAALDLHRVVARRAARTAWRQRRTAIGPTCDISS